MALLSDIQFTSWNVRGLNKTVKLKQVLNRIRQMKAKIVFLRETHLAPEDVVMVRKRWPGQVFSASFNSYSRGVLILIHNSIPLQIINTIEDRLGRHIIIQADILSVRLNLVNVYGPNMDNPIFYRNLFLILAELPGYFVIGGDFNCALYPDLDRSTKSDLSHLQTRIVLKQYMQDFNLIDIWRNRHPDSLTYSCYSSTYKTFSLIDYFLLSTDLISKVSKCWYDSILISDHAAVSFSLNFPNFVCRWRLHITWMRDPEFLDFIGKQIDYYFEINTNQHLLQSDGKHLKLL